MTLAMAQTRTAPLCPETSALTISALTTFFFNLTKHFAILFDVNRYLGLQENASRRLEDT